MTPEKFNAWRVFPRLFSLLYGAMLWFVVDWYMGLPDPTEAQSAFVGVVVASAAAWFKFYVESGNRD